MAASGLLSWWRCRRLRAGLVDLAEGTLAASERRVIEVHVVGCPRCRDALAGLRAVRGVLAGPPVGLPVDEAFWRRQRQEVMRAIRRLEPAPARRVPGLGWGVGVAAAAAALIAVANVRWTHEPVAPTVTARPAAAPLDDDALLALADAAADAGIDDEPLTQDDSDDWSGDLNDDDLEALGDLVGSG
ncbi:MAG: zf-HC2 domain-containing protein [Candidatus Binatia bacterium]